MSNVHMSAVPERPSPAVHVLVIGVVDLLVQVQRQHIQNIGPFIVSLTSSVARDVDSKLSLSSRRRERLYCKRLPFFPLDDTSLFVFFVSLLGTSHHMRPMHLSRSSLTMQRCVFF